MPAINATKVLEFLATQTDGATSTVIAKHFGVKSKLLNRAYTDEHADLFDPAWVGIYKLTGVTSHEFRHYYNKPNTTTVNIPLKFNITLKPKPKTLS